MSHALIVVNLKAVQTVLISHVLSLSYFTLPFLLVTSLNVSANLRAHVTFIKFCGAVLRLWPELYKVKSQVKHAWLSTV